MSREFTRNELEVTGAILRCEGTITNLQTGKVIDLKGMTVQQALAATAGINPVHGIGWKFTDCDDVVPYDWFIKVTGEVGQSALFRCFDAIKDFRAWANGGKDMTPWQLRKQAYGSSASQRGHLRTPRQLTARA